MSNSRQRGSLLPETAISEIEIAPDGRLFLFGASVQLLETLQQAGLGDAALQKRLAQAGPPRSVAAASPPQRAVSTAPTPRTPPPHG